MNTTAPVSALTHLECSLCAQTFDADRIQTYCPDCRTPLLARYDLAALRQRLTPQQVAQRPRGLWRWAELLPVRQPAYRLTLGEGDSALLRLPRLASELGMEALYLKDESSNPTMTFKARGLAVAVARAWELGVSSFVIPTAGNAGGALAAYCARIQKAAHVFMPNDAPEVNIQEVHSFGAALHLVDGLINEAGKQAASAAAQAAPPWFDVSTFKEPYRVEGKKTMGLELAEQFGYSLPDVIIYPTGGGTGLVGMWKAFDELEALGWIDSRRPRMVSVQAQGCPPVVRAFHDKSGRIQAWLDADTIAHGLRVPAPFADRLILAVLEASHGTAIAVSDEEMIHDQSALSQKEGIFPAPEGAATLSALRKLLAEGWIQPEEKVVLFNTGSGLKYL